MFLDYNDVEGLNNFLQSCSQVYGQHGLYGFYRGLPISLLLCSHGVV